MRTFFIATSIFVLSLLILTKTYRYIASKQKLYLFLAKYQAAIIFAVTLAVVLVPFILLSISKNLSTLGKLVNIFLVGLLISISFGLFIERIRVLIFNALSNTEKMKPESLSATSAYGAENEWRDTIEKRTLDRFGFDSTVGISFDSIDRLGNTLEASLEQGIDSLEIK